MIRYVPSGAYFTLVKVDGKLIRRQLIRRSLDTLVLEVANPSLRGLLENLPTVQPDESPERPVREPDVKIIGKGAGFGVRELAPAFKSGGKPPLSTEFQEIGLWPAGRLPENPRSIPERRLACLC